MKKIFLSLICITTFSFAQLEFSGFTDILYVQDQGFGYGQFELDLAAPLSDGITVDAAMAYDGSKIVMGAGFITMDILGKTSLMLGQFDVPFGIDYRHIASPARKLVTAPLLNQKTLNSWNDMGLNFAREADTYNFNLFLVNGFLGEMAIGGRFGFKPLTDIEVGVSMVNDNDDAILAGADLQATLGFIETRFEFQTSDGYINGGYDPLSDDRGHSGYYVHFCGELEDMTGLPIFGIIRYGSWDADADRDGSGEKDNAMRITAGLGYRLAETVELRLEYLSDTFEDLDPENIFTMQTVVSF